MEIFHCNLPDLAIVFDSSMIGMMLLPSPRLEGDGKEEGESESSGRVVPAHVFRVPHEKQLFGQEKIPQMLPGPWYYT